MFGVRDLQMELSVVVRTNCCVVGYRRKCVDQSIRITVAAAAALLIHPQILWFSHSLPWALLSTTLFPGIPSAHQARETLHDPNP